MSDRTADFCFTHQTVGCTPLGCGACRDVRITTGYGESPLGLCAQRSRVERSGVDRDWADCFASTHARRALLPHEYLHPTANRASSHVTLRRCLMMRRSVFARPVSLVCLHRPKQDQVADPAVLTRKHVLEREREFLVVVRYASGGSAACTPQDRDGVRTQPHFPPDQGPMSAHYGFPAAQAIDPTLAAATALLASPGSSGQLSSASAS